LFKAIDLLRPDATFGFTAVLLARGHPRYQWVKDTGAKAKCFRQEATRAVAAVNSCTEKKGFFSTFNQGSQKYVKE